MKSYGLNVHYAATTAVDGLKDDVRRHLIEAVNRLETKDPAEWPATEVVPLPGPETRYLLHLPPSYRVILSRTDMNELEIQSIFHEEAWRLWGGQGGKNGSQAG